MTAARPDPLADELGLHEPDPSTLVRQYEAHLLAVLVWRDDDGSLTRQVDGIVQPTDFLRPEFGDLYRWHLRYVAAFETPDGAGLCHRMNQHAARLRSEGRAPEAARLDALAVEAVNLGQVDTFAARVLHYAQQVRFAAVVRQLELECRRRLQELRFCERLGEALERVVVESREAEDAALGRLRGQP